MARDISDVSNMIPAFRPEDIMGDEGEPEIEIRLAYHPPMPGGYPRGSWTFNSGLPDYDTSVSPFTECATATHPMTLDECRELARALVDGIHGQIADAMAAADEADPLRP